MKFFHGHLRPCAQCFRRRPSLAFPLLNDPAAEKWATRRWCEDCLVDGGHLRPEPDYRIVARHVGEKDKAAAERRVREHQLAVRFTDAALADPAVEAAMRRALDAMELARTGTEKAKEVHVALDRAS